MGVDPHRSDADPPAIRPAPRLLAREISAGWFLFVEDDNPDAWVTTDRVVEIRR